MVSEVAGYEETILELDAKINASLKVEFIEDFKKVRLIIMDYHFDHIRYIDKGSTNLRFTKMLLNHIIPFFLADSENCLNLKIPIENPFFKL